MLLLLALACNGTDPEDSGDDTDDVEVGLDARPANPDCAGFARPGEPGGLPTSLLATGCVDPNDGRLPGPGLIPYALNAPFWSDGAEKQRFMGLPDGRTVAIDDGDFVFPNGTVLLKTFDRFGERLETRLLIRHADGEWAGYSFYWESAASTDATLLDDGGFRDLGDGHEWFYPGPYDCLYCHSEPAGRSLGPEVAQLNRDFAYPTGITSNQLTTLSHIGVFSAPVGEASDLPALADPTGDAPVEDRARAWLHSNCSHCHRPEGPSGRDFDLRAGVPFGQAEVCGVEPAAPHVEGAHLISPGDPDNSTIVFRLTDPAQRMPPIGVTEPDTAGIALLSEWIASLSGCP